MSELPPQNPQIEKPASKPLSNEELVARATDIKGEELPEKDEELPEEEIDEHEVKLSTKPTDEQLLESQVAVQRAVAEIGSDYAEIYLDEGRFLQTMHFLSERLNEIKERANTIERKDIVYEWYWKEFSFYNSIKPEAEALEKNELTPDEIKQVFRSTTHTWNLLINTVTEDSFEQAYLAKTIEQWRNEEYSHEKRTQNLPIEEMRTKERARNEMINKIENEVMTYESDLIKAYSSPERLKLLTEVMWDLMHKIKDAQESDYAGWTSYSEIREKVQQAYFDVVGKEENSETPQ